jgi:Ribosomal protein HS6-type (S12/L30/L7a)
MRSKLESYLGFAKKSRNLISGTNTCLHGMNQGKVLLLILAEDLAENTMEKLKKAAEDKKIDYRIIGTMAELSRILGYEERGVFGITDKNFADVISKEIDDKSVRTEGR